MINKVFGIGLSKTGTSSLSDALNTLGIKSMHYPDDEVTFNELRNGNYNLSILQEYQGLADTPVVPYYAQFDRIFPNSKFILTIRDMNSWLVSVQKHWETATTFQHQPTRRAFQEFIRIAVYGSVEFNRDRFQYVYETHIHNVTRYFADRPSDLLVLNICAGEGWEKLAPFLNLSQPQEPFPHANQWMHKLIQASEEIRMSIPHGESFLLIDDQALGINFSEGRILIPYNEINGIYMGAPIDSESAISEINRIIETFHPNYLVVAWPSFWWMRVYPDLFTHLQGKYESILQSGELFIYKLV